MVTGKFRKKRGAGRSRNVLGVVPSMRADAIKPAMASHFRTIEPHNNVDGVGGTGHKRTHPTDDARWSDSSSNGKRCQFGAFIAIQSVRPLGPYGHCSLSSTACQRVGGTPSGGSIQLGMPHCGQKTMHGSVGICPTIWRLSGPGYPSLA